MITTFNALQSLRKEGGLAVTGAGRGELDSLTLSPQGGAPPEEQHGISLSQGVHTSPLWAPPHYFLYSGLSGAHQATLFLCP